MWVIGGVAAGVVVIGLVAALSRGDGASARAPSPPASPSPALRPSERPFEPPQGGLAPPPDLDHKGMREWNKIAEKANQGDVGEALDKLGKFERKFGSSSETEQLRAYLEQFVRWEDD
jgi:hypothetical protein